MNYKITKEIIENFYPAIIILLLFILRFISFTQILIGYLIYCTYIYFTTKTYLYYIKTKFNNELLKNCPSIRDANFKQYFLLPFTFCQFILFQMANQRLNQSNNKQIIFQEEKVDDKGTSIFWASQEKALVQHINPVLLILPGITGHYYDPYVKNIISEGIKNNFDVVVFQMRTLSNKMKLEENKNVDFYEDLDNSLKKIKEKNNNKLYGIGYSYGANLLTGYLGSLNFKTSYIDGGVAVSNPFDLYMSQRIGQETLYETLICFFERKNYINAVNSINKNNNVIDVNILESSYSVKIFDKEFFGKILGYKNADDYYRGISSAKYVKYVNKPLLVIHSKDDPICSFKGIPIDDVRENKNIIFIATEKGGHFCYIENEKDFSFSGRLWSFKPSLEFLNYLKNN